MSTSAWSEADTLTRAAVVVAAAVVATIVVPPIAVLLAIVGAAFSGVALVRTRRAERTNPLAVAAGATCVALVAIMFIGNAVYAN